jgi:hypothetical protein
MTMPSERRISSANASYEPSSWRIGGCGSRATTLSRRAIVIHASTCGYFLPEMTA